MANPRIVDRGDGPKIEGTRITVYTVLDYLRAGRTRDWIAALLHLSSDQVQAAMDYIRECVLYTFEDLDLPEDATDATIWQACQDRDNLIITGNRNAEGPESLEITIRQRNTPNCLPVLTLADPDRIQRDRAYAELAVERLFDILIDPDALRGTGRLYLP